MEKLTEPSVLAFLLQALTFIFPWPLIYIAYRFVRAPLKRAAIKRSLFLLGIPQTREMEQLIGNAYGLRNYWWPLSSLCFVTFILFAWTHPFIISRGLAAGLWEEATPLFGSNVSIPTAILNGRYVFLAFMGAWLYSFLLLSRRFLDYDLTPSAIFFATIRIVMAYFIGIVVGAGLAVYSSAAGVSFNVNIVTVYIVVFFIGFFPEQGMNWIITIAKRALRQRKGLVKEVPLSDIEGISIWHQGRLRQEGIENAQNLATADIATLVSSTPFTLNQIIDWIDQAILLVISHSTQFEALEKVGLRCASDVITAVEEEEQLDELSRVSHLEKNGLRMLYLALRSAPNVNIVARFRWQSSLDSKKREQAADLLTDLEAVPIPDRPKSEV